MKLQANTVNFNFIIYVLVTFDQNTSVSPLKLKLLGKNACSESEQVPKIKFIQRNLFQLINNNNYSILILPKQCIGTY